MKSIAHNYSSYVLSKDEELALSYGLENHIPTKTSHIAINTEFEQFYQRLLHDISHIPEEDLAHIKTKLPNTCKKYSEIRVPNKYRKIVETLSKNSRIVVMKQDKGRGVILMDRTVYVEKCLDILDTNQFTKVSTDPSKKTEEKIQRVLRKIKRSFSVQEYLTTYPTGSCLGKLYSTAKVYKLPENRNVDQLPIRPIVSNIGTATYQLAKHLAKLLPPLNQSRYTIKRTKDFIGKI